MRLVGGRYGPAEELELIRIARSLNHGSSVGEITRVAFHVVTTLGDAGSGEYWKRVCQLIAVGRLSPVIFTASSRAGVNRPAALIAAKVKKLIPDLNAANLPAWPGSKESVPTPRRLGIPGSQPQSEAGRVTA